MNPTVIKFDTQGLGHCLYTEQIDLTSIGSLQIVRASSIEFNNGTGEWEVKSAENEVMFKSSSRAVCLAWEQQYFNR